MLAETTVPRPIDAAELDARMAEFTELLHACVIEGASVNFVMPFGKEDAEQFWRQKVLPRLGVGRLDLLAIEIDGRIAGSIQLDRDTPPNQPHRGDVKKVLVHPTFQRRGLGRQLMAAVEGLAIEKGLSLLTLDTRTGDKGEPLYLSVGFKAIGVIPGYSRDVHSDRLDAATFLYKEIG